MADEDRKLHVEDQKKYWLRCLNSLLPNQYTSTDSNRMTLGFFILSALDLLDVDDDKLTVKHRKDIREWILKCQHPKGGFCGSPNHKYPNSYYAGDEILDPANLPATFFALVNLSYVGTYRDVVLKDKCMQWLRTLQREDGSFGELATADGMIQGGNDMRFCLLAVGVRWILLGDEPDHPDDIDVERLVDYLRACQTHDGGVSESSEAHAGYTYCAISTLGLLNRLPDLSCKPSSSGNIKGNAGTKSPGLTNLPATIKWLAFRQIEYIARIDFDSEPDEEDEACVLPKKDQADPLGGIYCDATEPLHLECLSLLGASPFVGFNGRLNKVVDTCYAFWVTASLEILGKGKLVDYEKVKAFLYEKTQHPIGGFGKAPGSPPDLYHSYFGLAALGMMNEPGVKLLDPLFAISKQQRDKIVTLRNHANVPLRGYWRHGRQRFVYEDDPDFERIMASCEGESEPVVVSREKGKQREQGGPSV